MSYKVHKYYIGNSIDDEALERFLNELSGEIVSIVPNVVPRFHLMGATARYDYIIIVERLGK